MSINLLSASQLFYLNYAQSLTQTVSPRLCFWCGRRLSLWSHGQAFSSANMIVSAFISSSVSYLSSSPPPPPPGQMLASKLTAYFRKKCVAVTDRRVRLMNEILGCIKFIKMYCWENAFAQNIHGERLSHFIKRLLCFLFPTSYFSVFLYIF